MGILVGPETSVIVQGITGRYARDQTEQMMQYGTNVVAGVRPGKGGQTILGLPIFDTVIEAVERTGANTAILYVGRQSVKEATLESIAAGMRLIMIAAEFVPMHDSVLVRARACESDVWVIGPNTIGLISPDDRTLLGTLLPDRVIPGNVGILSRSGTVAIQVTRLLGISNIGVSTCVGIGGDLITGRNPGDYIRRFAEDPRTEIIVLVGEVGGLKEYEAAEAIASIEKAVVACILGQSAPEGKKLGHVGAIVVGELDRAAPKAHALREAGAIIAERPTEIPTIVRSLLASS